MSETCAECGVSIDTAHDEHWRCPGGDCTAVWCAVHGRSLGRCPDCGRALEYAEASITKRLFEEPGIRGLLGF